MRLEVPDYVVLIVSELDRSLDFYLGTLGLELQHRSGPYAQLETGRTRLALYERDAMAATLGVEKLAAPDPAAPAFELGFKVADVDRVYADLLARGVKSAAPPTDRNWGQRTAYVRDPDGHLVELATDLPASRPAKETSS
ncbi:MAG: VOC family protein [Actinomycetota bacterium]|nr:VOC family protein [Actinomycetota bacterium]